VHTKDFEIPQISLAMRELEEHLIESVKSDDPFLTEISTHLIGAGGKRLRPTLALASSLAIASEISERSYQGAVAVELVHLASLHHDDVMDEASSRRNVESVNSRWGNLLAVVTGDFLLARAAGIAARLGSEVAELLADTLADMCAGQVLEVKSGFDITRNEKDYLEAISGKTASLYATSCKIGATVVSASEREKSLLNSLGHSFGMIFQIRDDILDLVADRTTLGKTPGQDLIEGVYTLPVIYGLSDEGSRDTLAKHLSTAQIDIDSVNKVLYEHGAFLRSVEKLDHYLQQCKEAANDLNSAPIWDVVEVAGSLVDSVTQILEDLPEKL
jgi:heptaprenyl diphosphate synthase